MYELEMPPLWLLLLLPPLLLPPLPSGPHITRRIGKSFAQLLTKSAVLMAVGLAGAGGGSGCTFRIGAVEARLKGGGGGGGGRGE